MGIEINTARYEFIGIYKCSTIRNIARWIGRCKERRWENGWPPRDIWILATNKVWTLPPNWQLERKMGKSRHFEVLGVMVRGPGVKRRAAKLSGVDPLTLTTLGFYSRGPRSDLQ